MILMQIRLGLLLYFSISLIACKYDQKNIQSTNLSNDYDTLEVLNHRIFEHANSDSLYIDRAKYYFQNETFDSAIIDIRRAISLNPKQANYYFYLSDAYLMSYDSKKALAILDTAIAEFPDYIPVFLKKAKLQLILKSHMNAIATLDRVFILDPQNADGYYLAGHILSEMGDTGRAINSYQKAVDLNPDLREAWIQLGDVMTSLNNPLALRYYENAIRLDTSDIETMHNRAYALQKFGKLNEAIFEYKSNISNFPGYELSYYNLALLYSKSDSNDLAIKYFTNAINLNDQEPSSYYQRGRCYEKLSKKAEALVDYKKAIELDHNYSEAKKSLSRLEKQYN